MKKNIFLDLRINIGLVLTIIGLLITITGIVSSPTKEALDGLNIDLIWGIVTTVVGLFFLGLYLKNPNMDE
ncbi:hypothetical protein OEV98_03910 [Caldibacillus lycopersici]|uniref:Uncharacterized protein n=1 Tax=Perspicuibacillus lycopersici TaxID=1325689 RepID=A0AAE3IQG6_9BACI|nr:hypothetical protein [Perspicuibacillus lycopersici]MCU9612710.1 hypothetical protein [Perspicuibacillus lycopersici]